MLSVKMCYFKTNNQWLRPLKNMNEYNEVVKYQKWIHKDYVYIDHSNKFTPNMFGISKISTITVRINKLYNLVLHLFFIKLIDLGSLTRYIHDHNESG